ncbi:NlpC/P60 family protein [Brevundimonas faecalis]|uniref:Cell wall-associated NlpC family hydrolase n=1 Tax=Brevundimonas faecalis TaxID=947378 RepID=A0ABV2RB85_9CAUL
MKLYAPADLRTQVAPLVGAPFLAKGETPAGWDCKGLARWCLKTFGQVETPDYQDRYAADIVTPRGAGERARLLAEGLAEWRPVEPQAGVVAWLSWMGRAYHVGYMLGPREILHADTPFGTVILDLDEPGAGYRLKGAFVPAGVTKIVRL